MSSYLSIPLKQWASTPLYIKYNSLLTQLTGSKVTNKQQMDQTHTQTTIIMHKQAQRLFHNTTNVIRCPLSYSFKTMGLSAIIFKEWRVTRTFSYSQMTPSLLIMAYNLQRYIRPRHSRSDFINFIFS
jgi:hypothetical protein